jgi:hypothetical protein
MTTKRKKSVPDKYAKDAYTWLIWAENTYAGACELFHPEKPGLWFAAAQLGALALEMFLKAALIRNGHTIVEDDVWGHDLPWLAKTLAAEENGFPSEVVSNVGVFSDLFDELRYPKELKKVGGLGEQEAQLQQPLSCCVRTQRLASHSLDCETATPILTKTDHSACDGWTCGVCASERNLFL